MKLLFLGIDALDILLLEALEEQLPNLTRLRNEGTSLKVQSTFPPDSDTAWATIVTGLNPAQHGIVRFVDPLEKVDQIQNVGSDNEILQGKTFWELLGKAGLKAHAIFPHLCYPIWNTPGVMVARGSSTINGKRVPGIQANPPELLAEYPNPDTLLGTGGFPERGIEGLRAYAKKLFAMTEADAEFALGLMQKLEWDLFFVYLPTIDAAGHFFWNYYDRDDPGFVEGHPLQNTIPDLYKLYDDIVGQYLEAVEDDVTVIIMSDHGHGARPFNLVNVNDILRQAGFLKARDIKRNPHLNLIEKFKRTGIQVVSRYGLAKLAGSILRHVPYVKESLTRPSKINWNETVAYASDMSGIKAYTYGGVIINKEALGHLDYETVRDEVISLLKRECVLPDGTSLIDFIGKREELYCGQFLTNYPDILLEFKYGYGLGWDVHVPLITRAASHNLVPGSHRGATGTFIMRGRYEADTATIDLRDLVPTILNFMGVCQQNEFEGQNLFQKLRQKVKS
jgi:predicted AlkP superfamily phosphohydrolase/phosphomutase